MTVAQNGPLKLALLGCGEDAKSCYAPAMARYASEHPDRLQLTAVCDSDAERAEQFRQEFGFAAASPDVEAMFRDHRPAACACVLAADESAVQVQQLLAQKTPCLLAAPLGKSPDDVLEMSDAARESGATHMLAMTRRFNPYLTRAVRWARQLGDIRSVTATVGTDGPIEKPFMGDTVIHSVDVICHVLGRVEGHAIAPAADQQAGSPREHSISLKFPEDLDGRLCLHPGADGREETYELTGEGFRAVVALEGHEAPSLLCWRGDKLEVKIVGPPAETPVDDGTYNVLCRFVECLGDGRDASPTIEDVLPALDCTFHIAEEMQDTQA